MEKDFKDELELRIVSSKPRTIGRAQPALWAQTETWLIVIVLWEAFRDPIRKLMPDHLVGLSLLGAAFWLIAGLSVVLGQRGQGGKTLFPQSVKVASALLGLSLVLGAGAGIANNVPWLVLLLGASSYLFPIVGLFVGFHFAGTVDALGRLAGLFCVLNGVLMLASLAEIAGIESRVIGGIMMEWYRYRGTHSIPLPSGIYRSPDILGYHAAHVFGLSAILLQQARQSRWRYVFGMLVVWGGVALVLSARRKMQGLVFAFLIVWGLFVVLRNREMSHHWRRFISWRLAAWATGLAVVVGLAAGIWFPAQVVYASSILWEGPARVATSLISAPWTTIQQSGFWGIGLGTATQGNRILGEFTDYGWQEDGTSRVILETGVIGCLLLLTSCWLIIRLIVKQIAIVVASRAQVEQWKIALFALMMGNFACLVISHQHLSGDPVFSGFLGFAAGILIQQPSEGELGAQSFAASLGGGD